MKRPSAILFDWDNTLVDSWGCIQHAMNETLLSMGHPTWDLDEIKSRVARSLKDSFPELFGERWLEARDIFYRSFAAIHLERLQPLPGAAETLQRLRAAGIPLGVVSNKSGPFIRKEAEFLAWQGYFDRLVGAGDAAEDKPSPLPVQLVLETMRLPAAESVWFIGDAAIDMQCARNAGLSPILLRHDAVKDEQAMAHIPCRNFQSWDEFQGFLDEILVP